VLALETGGTLQLAAADPAQSNTGVIHLEFDRAVARVTEKDEAITVERTAPTLRIVVNVENARGRTLAMKCEALP